MKIFSVSILIIKNEENRREKRTECVIILTNSPAYITNSLTYIYIVTYFDFFIRR